MPTASENHRMITEYYEPWGAGGAAGVTRLARYYAEEKTSYIAGNSAFSGYLSTAEETEQFLIRLLELNEGGIDLVGRPQIILAGDTFVAVILMEKHTRVGRDELIVPRLCIYEILDGKIAKSFLWQIESAAYDGYYPC